MNEHDALDLALTTIRRVRALHAPLAIATSMPGCEVICTECKDHDLGQYGNYVPWPCPTIQILDGALMGGSV